MPDVRSVIVAIPTFRRPKGLQRLLAALAAQRTDASVTVLVADNDAEGCEGLALVERIRADGYRWPLRAILVAERGIAAARNGLMKAALADPAMDALAMLDDDEWPEPNWLEALLTEQAKTGADALQGSILFDHAERPAAWAEHFDGLADIRAPSGPIAMLQGTGNLLVMRAALETLKAPWFDPAFALGGGEDRDFLERLKARGARFAWSDEAVAHHPVASARNSLGWALTRAYSIGNSDMCVFLKHTPGMGAKAREIAKILAAFLLAPAAFVLLAFDSGRRADALRRTARAAGKLAALCGRRYNEYAVTHGD